MMEEEGKNEEGDNEVEEKGERWRRKSKRRQSHGVPGALLVHVGASLGDLGRLEAILGTRRDVMLRSSDVFDHPAIIGRSGIVLDRSGIK